MHGAQPSIDAPHTFAAGILDTIDIDRVETLGDALRRLDRSGALDLPLPGSGATEARFVAFSEFGAIDLSLARLVEGHCDAIAILRELGHEPHDGTYGVWAAEGVSSHVDAVRVTNGYRLSGRRRFCSGASTLSRALISAQCGHERLLFDLDVSERGIRRIGESWQAVGMANSDSLDIELCQVFVASDDVIGGPGAYLARPGFWHGAVGVAACWFGGALGCMRMLRARLRAGGDDHALAHLGAIVAACRMLQVSLAQAAREIDADAANRSGGARARALALRAAMVEGCERVLAHTAHAAGTSPCVFDRRHARRIADLPVYLRQHHAERDLAELGRLSTTDEACR